MIERDEETRIKGLFERLHEQDRPPAFAELWPRAERYRPPLRLLPVAALLVLAVLAGWLFVARWQQPEVELTAAQAQALADSLSAWEGPLDFLLETPGSEYLATVPAFGFENAEMDVNGNS